MGGPRSGCSPCSPSSPSSRAEASRSARRATSRLAARGLGRAVLPVPARRNPAARCARPGGGRVAAPSRACDGDRRRGAPAHTRPAWLPPAATADHAQPQAVAGLVRCDVALVPDPGRRGPALRGTLAAPRSMASHLGAPRVRRARGPLLDRLGRRSQLAPRGRELRGRDHRFRLPGAPPGAPEPSHRRPCDDRAPRHLFGVVFESRPPPLPA